MIIPKSLEIASGVHLIAVSDDLTTISITYPRGFRSDIPRIGGSAHLFEHLLLAPTREHDPYDTLEYLGFLLSAQTRRDYTTVSATGPSEHARDC